MRKQKVQRGLEGSTSKIAEGAPQSWNQRFSSPELGAGCCDYKARSLGLTEVVLAKGVSWAVLLKDPRVLPCHFLDTEVSMADDAL